MHDMIDPSAATTVISPGMHPASLNQYMNPSSVLKMIRFLDNADI